MMKQDIYSSMIELLEKNAVFPKYQLERRIDIFINFFLSDIIHSFFNGKYQVDLVIPELPIRKQPSFLSFNLDYLIVCKNPNIGFLVELKTNSSSFRADQFRLYNESRKMGYTYPPYQPHILGQQGFIYKLG